jgi:hypothetical protein
VTPEEYRAQQAQYAERAEATVLAVAAGSALSGYSLASALGIYLASVNAAANALADAWTSAFLSVPPMGIALPIDEPDRLTEAVVTILEDQRSENTPALPRLARVASTEPTVTARRASQTVMKTNNVKRMKWINDPKPCAFCIDLASRTHAVAALPKSHPHCACTTIPIRPTTKENEQ